MKRIYLVGIVGISVFISVFLVSCEQTESFKIQGKVSQSDIENIYLTIKENGKYTVLDTAKVENGTFNFSGKVDVAEPYYLKDNSNDMVVIFIENTTFEVSIDSLIENAVIKGGQFQQHYNSFKVSADEKSEMMMSEYQNALEAGGENADSLINAKVMPLYEDLEKFTESFMMENLATPVGMYILSQNMHGKSAEELYGLLAKVDTIYSNLRLYQTINNRAVKLEAVSIGKIAPNFTQTDADGNLVTLSNIYAQNKLTLIDFWASWCGPCRQENPNIVAAYQRFKNDGFGIVGVSMDQSRDNWLKAIQDDKLTWVHVSDLKGWGNEAGVLYAVNSIPASFLVDQQGKILASNLRGDELIEKIKEMLNSAN